MPQQAGQKGNHGARHASHLNQQTQKYEQWHGQQNKVRHAFIHPAHDCWQGRSGCQRQIAEGSQAESKRNRNTGKDTATGHPNKENQQIQSTQIFKQRRSKPEGNTDASHDSDSL